MKILVMLLAYGAALFVFARLLRSSDQRRALPYVAALATLLFFAAANLVNLCSPGWCEHFGFPLKYEGWSDAQFVMDGVNSGVTAFSPTSLAFNIVVGASAAGVVFALFRSRAHASAA